MNYGDLDGINRFYEKLRPLKLHGRSNLVKYDNLATLQKIFSPQSTFMLAYMDIINKYAEKDKEGKIALSNNSPKIIKDMVTDYNREINELLNEECEVSFTPINLKTIMDALDEQPDYDLGWDDNIILFFEHKGIIIR